MAAPLSVLLAILPAVLPAAAAPSIPADQWQASGKRGAVVAGQRESVEAGLALLARGGNAIDAAAAVLLALSVTDSQKFAFGSELSFMVYDAKRGAVEVLNGQGAAPRLATRAHFASRKDGIPASGLEPAAVPGVLDAVVTALARHGTRTFAEAAAPALALLDRGAKPWHADLARTLRRLIAAERSAGKDRIRGLRLVSDLFYRGEIAREIDAFSRQKGGLIRFADLATHTTRIEDPLSVTYRGRTIYKPGPTTQGPYLLQAMQLLEGWELGKLPRAEAVHLMAEATKLALADRDAHYGDPSFADVPVEALLAPAYAQARRALIDAGRASRVQRPGDPRGGKALAAAADARRGLGGPSLDTSTCLVADAQGNVVAATPSGWSGVLVGNTGIWLGTRLQSFNLWEGHPNAIEPGKRPRNTLTPTLVFERGKPAIAISVAGGDAQDQFTLQLLVDLIDFGMTPAQAVTGPFFVTNHHVGSFRQKAPALGNLDVYDGFGAEVLGALRAKGHDVVVKKRPMADPTVLLIDRKGGRFVGAGDLTAERHAGAL